MAPDHAGLDWLSDVFGKYYPVDMPLPRTYPMADGGVSLEWSFGEREADVEINLKSRARRVVRIQQQYQRVRRQESEAGLLRLATNF